MSAKRRVPWPLVFVVAVGVALFLSQRAPSLPTGGEAITTPVAYDAVRAKMGDLVVDRIQKSDLKQSLTTDDLDKLREAGGLLDRMIQYYPTNAANYFLRAKIHAILGEPTLAIDSYRQCVFVSPNDAATNTTQAATINGNAAQANYEMSLLLLMQGDKQGAFDAADAAVKAFPATSTFLTARGSALNELRRTPEAKKDLEAALSLDPKNARAASLLRFIAGG